jgi:hypothetical protein
MARISVRRPKQTFTNFRSGTLSRPTGHATRRQDDIRFAAVAGVSAVLGGLAGCWNTYQTALGAVSPTADNTVEQWTLR